MLNIEPVKVKIAGSVEPPEDMQQVAKDGLYQAFVERFGERFTAAQLVEIIEAIREWH